jgi:hypothetical protein
MIEPFAHAMVSEPASDHFCLVEKVPSVEDVGRFFHQFVELSVGVCSEDIPFGEDDDRV